MTEQAQDLAIIYTKKGAEQVPVLARWTEKVGSGDYDFVLHVIPQEGEYNPVLGISEVQTGASLQAPLVHPNGSGQLRESHTKPGHRGYLPADKLQRLAYRALKRQLSLISDERFEMMVGVNLTARHMRDQALLSKRNEKMLDAEAEHRGEEEAKDEAAFDAEQAAVEEKPVDDVQPEVELPTVTSVKDDEQ